MLRRPLSRSFVTRAAAKVVKLHEVSPRDGLQNEKAVLPTPTKLELMRRLVLMQPESIEVTSFVNVTVP